MTLFFDFLSGNTFEQLFYSITGDPNTCVLHLKDQLRLIYSMYQCIYIYADFTMGGKLNSIFNQVHKCLLQSLIVSNDLWWHTMIHIIHQVKTDFTSFSGKHLQHFLYAITQIKIFVL